MALLFKGSSLCFLSVYKNKQKVLVSPIFSPNWYIEFHSCQMPILPSLNSPFYSCFLSDLAFVWKRG